MPDLHPPSLPGPPRRVVSLVPSVTESLFALGLGEAVAAATDYCVHPAERTAQLPKVGGTKNARLAEILAVNPDLVIANQEENLPETVQALRAAGVPVWLTFPKSVQDALAVLTDLAGLFRSQTALAAVEALATAVEYAWAARPAPVRVFCPVWFDRLADGTPWWMTFNAQTYPHDVLDLWGGTNVFGGRARRYPLEADLGRAAAIDPEERDVRYPRVSMEEVHAAAPEVVLLPSEPYEFTDQDRFPLVDLLGEGTRVEFVDGSLLTWHGTRLAQAIRNNPLHV